MAIHTEPNPGGAPAPAARQDHLLQLATDLLDLGTWTLALPTMRLTLSGRAAALLGQPAGSEPDWEAVLEGVDPADRQGLRQALATCLSSPSPVEHSFRVGAASGTPRWLRLRAAAVRDGGGQVLAVDGVCQDVSDTKRAEQAIAETETRFRALVEGLQRVSVQGYDHQRRVIFWNGASEQLYGYTREEALGRQLEDLIIPPEMRELVIEGTRQWLESGVVSVPAEELVLRHKDGSPVPVFSSHTMQRSLSGEAQLYCVDVDLSERVAAEAERQQLEAQLREAQKMEALGTMAGGIAHDFNHVLGAVLANVSLASGMLPAGHPALAPLDLVARGGRRARRMVQQILAFSRHQALELRPVDLVEEARHALALLQANRRTGVTLVLNYEERPLWVSADAAQLQQVLLNLCTNAAQALPEHGGRIEVALQRLPAGPGDAVAPVRLTVRDDGRGMDAATLARVFEPFFTTKAVGQGSGLGLSVVHGIVLAHHGHIHVESQPGQGTSVHVDLPGLDEDAVEVAASEWAGLPDDSPPPRGRPLVIYVDDDDVMRLTVQALLERAGYRVRLCSNARQALDALAQAPGEAAVLVTDFNMPDGDGLALTQAVRERHPGLPVLISSGYVSDALTQDAHALGVQAVLHKERVLEDLIAHVRGALQSG
ncbi:MAG: PAS domain S-box protein [Roseateles sp.]|uniref:hybrid sensor histidine kinase/response regulator n=1 Tax=Roseateles sp. TaxID=1971397 RepID=UPI0039E748F7